VTILEGESLFNDATALTMLHVAVAAVTAETASGGYAVRSFLLASIGGAAIGVAGGAIASWIRTHDVPPIVGASLSVVTPFALFLAGEEAHTSGVIAVVVAGLMLSHRSPMDQGAGARLTESSMWSVIQYLLEGAVFGLIGLQLPDIVRGVHEDTAQVIAVCGSVLAVVLAVRPLWLFGVSYIAKLVRRSYQPNWRGITIISWAGMRGVISLAAAGSLPLDFPRRNLLLLVTVVVIVGTLGLQGLTLPTLIRRLGVSAPDPRQDALQIAHAQEQAGSAALERLDELAGSEDIPKGILDRLRTQVEWRTFSGWEKLGPSGGDEAPTRALARLRREMVNAEREVFVQLRDSGELDDDVLRMIQRRLDLEESMLIGIDHAYSSLEGHQEVLPPHGAPGCNHLEEAPSETPVADPRECPTCVELGRRDWVHLRACLSCGQIGCCDSSPLRHATAHYEAEGHPVMGSAEEGESWRWCFKHQRIG
jgi:CPA1 family monovalent cation:H+ antiporter